MTLIRESSQMKAAQILTSLPLFSNRCARRSATSGDTPAVEHHHIKRCTSRCILSSICFTRCVYASLTLLQQHALPLGKRTATLDNTVQDELTGLDGLQALSPTKHTIPWFVVSCDPGAVPSFAQSRRRQGCLTSLPRIILRCI